MREVTKMRRKQSAKAAACSKGCDVTLMIAESRRNTRCNGPISSALVLHRPCDISWGAVLLNCSGNYTFHFLCVSQVSNFKYWAKTLDLVSVSIESSQFYILTINIKISCMLTSGKPSGLEIFLLKQCKVFRVTVWSGKNFQGIFWCGELVPISKTKKKQRGVQYLKQFVELIHNQRWSFHFAHFL